MTRRRLAMAAAMVILAGACSEEALLPGDETPPRIELLSPAETQTVTITDSARVVLWAEDASGIERVELWCTVHGESAARRIASVARPDSAHTYSFAWDTRNEPTGTAGVLWAVAVDGAGNRGRTSGEVSIVIVNTTGRRAPYAAFTISPSSGGRADLPLTFDPSRTRDDVDDPVRLRVRWDFGDGTVIEVSEGLNTTDCVTHTYTRSDSYTIRLEVWNTYYPFPDVIQRTYIVLPYGIPPVESSPTVRLPADTYPIGVIDVPGGVGNDYSARELVSLSSTPEPDTLRVSISTDLKIDQYEVTNELYVAFLNAAREQDLLAHGIDGSTTIIRGAEGEPWLHLKGSQGEELSRILYFDDDIGFAVNSAWKRFPVTGVTWYGAKAYAHFYGRRLPTEYEWEAAARGQRIDSNWDDTHIYPWPDATVIAGEYANFAHSGDPFEIEGGNLRAETPVGGYSTAYGALLAPLLPVDARGPFGTYDQAGNVAEWVEDGYQGAIYEDWMAEAVASGLPPADPPPAAADDLKVIRGGDFLSDPEDLRVTYRRGMPPTEGNARTGFRTIHALFDVPKR